MRTFTTKMKVKLFHVIQYLIEEWLYSFLAFVADVLNEYHIFFLNAHKKALNENLALVLFHKIYYKTSLFDSFVVALPSASSPLSSLIISIWFDFQSNSSFRSFKFTIILTFIVNNKLLRKCCSCP